MNVVCAPFLVAGDGTATADKLTDDTPTDPGDDSDTGTDPGTDTGTGEPFPDLQR